MFDGSNLSVTTAAIARPEIFSQTLDTFEKRLIGLSLKEIDIFLNIDPVPNNKAKIDEVVKLAERFFRVANIRISTNPNLVAALEWTWENANTDFILHLDDDYLLLSNVILKEIYDGLVVDELVVQYLLKAFLYETPFFPTSPAFLKKVYYKNFVGKLDHRLNTEIQMRNEKLWPFPNMKKLIYGNRIIVKHIGPDWNNKNNFVRPLKGTYVGFK